MTTATIPTQREDTKTREPLTCDRPGCDRLATWLAMPPDCNCTAVACDPCKEEAAPTLTHITRMLYAAGCFGCTFCKKPQSGPPHWEPLR